MSMYYDRDGQPIGRNTWASLYQGERHVGLTQVADGVTVSTVWMGLDHQFGDGPPLIFETMVFGGPLDEEQERYSTEKQALAGHAAMVERVREAAS